MESQRQRQKLINRLKALNGIQFEIKQQKRRYEETKDNVTLANLQTLETEYLMIEKAITSIQDPRKREVIRLRYIDNATWKAIAFEFYGSECDFVECLDRYTRRCYDLRNAALKELVELIK